MSSANTPKCHVSGPAIPGSSLKESFFACRHHLAAAINTPWEDKQSEFERRFQQTLSILSALEQNGSIKRLPDEEEVRILTEVLEGSELRDPCVKNAWGQLCHTQTPPLGNILASKKALLEKHQITPEEIQLLEDFFHDSRGISPLDILLALKHIRQNCEALK